MGQGVRWKQNKARVEYFLFIYFYDPIFSKVFTDSNMRTISFMHIMLKQAPSFRNAKHSAITLTTTSCIPWRQTIRQQWGCKEFRTGPREGQGAGCLLEHRPGKGLPGSGRQGNWLHPSDCAVLGHAARLWLSSIFRCWLSYKVERRAAWLCTSEEEADNQRNTHT